LHNANFFSTPLLFFEKCLSLVLEEKIVKSRKIVAIQPKWLACKYALNVL
jgi:hypothetical protein